MKSLEEMTLPQRIILTIIIVLVILFALALFGWSTGRWDEAPAAITAIEHAGIYEGIALDAKLLPLDKEALDASYRAHLQLLFSVWLKDAAGDSTRIRNGLKIARRAYHEADQEITKRANELLKDKEQK